MIVSRKQAMFALVLIIMLALTTAGCRQSASSTSGKKEPGSKIDGGGSNPEKAAASASNSVKTYFAKARITTGIEGSGECGSIAEYTVNLHGNGRVSGKIKLHEIDFLTCKPKKERVLTLYGKHFPAKAGGGTFKAGTIENGKKSGVFLDGSYFGETLSMTGSHNEGLIGAVTKMKIFVEDLPQAP